VVDRLEWIKGQWSFGLPLGIYANVVERVPGTPARLDELVFSLPREFLTWRDGVEKVSTKY
jgi:hypothetical protein